MSLNCSNTHTSTSGSASVYKPLNGARQSRNPEKIKCRYHEDDMSFLCVQKLGRRDRADGKAAASRLRGPGFESRLGTLARQDAKETEMKTNGFDSKSIKL